MTARDRSKQLFNKGKANAEKVRDAVAKRTEKSETMQSAVEKLGASGCARKFGRVPHGR